MDHFVLLFKYALVGTLGMTADLVFLYALVDVFRVPVLAATTLSFLSASLVTFTLNKCWTFRDKNRAVSKQLVKFYLVSSVGLLLTLGSMWLLVYGFGLWYLPAKVLTSAIVLLWNFSANRYWTFKRGAGAPASRGTPGDAVSSMSRRTAAVKSLLKRASPGCSHTERSPARLPILFVGGLVLLLVAGTTFMRNKVWRNDWELWQDAVRQSPDKGRPHYHLAVLLDKKGRSQEAIVEYGIALRLSGRPASGVSGNDIGHIYARLGRFEEAIAALQAVLVDNPQDDAAHTNLGVIYTQLGNLNEAIRQFEAVLAVNPGNEQALYNLGNAYQEVGLSREAETAYRSALEMNPGSAGAHNNLGLLYGRQGRLTEAVREFSAAIAGDPDDSEPFNNIGIVYAKLGRFQDAIQAFQQALSRGPESAELHENLGLAYQRSGNSAAALREFEQALQIEPRYRAAQYQVAAMRKEMRQERR